VCRRYDGKNALPVRRLGGLDKECICPRARRVSPKGLLTQIFCSCSIIKDDVP